MKKTNYFFHWSDEEKQEYCSSLSPDTWSVLVTIFSVSKMSNLLDSYVKNMK